MPPGKDRNKPSCVGGRTEPNGEVDRPVSPPKESKDKGNLVRIGSKFYSKDVTSTKRFQFGIELGKSPSGIRVKSLNEVVSEKERTSAQKVTCLPRFGDD